MTKEEKMLVRVVCEEAYGNEDENPSKGDYFIGRYVDYWKSGDYFHKKSLF